MRRFLYLLLVILALTGLLFVCRVGFLCWWYRGGLNAEYRLRPQTKIIAIGDSHVMNAIPADDVIQNFSASSIPHWQVLMRLHEISEKSPFSQLQYAVFGLSCHSTSGLVTLKSQRDIYTRYLYLSSRHHDVYPYRGLPISISLFVKEPRTAIYRKTVSVANHNNSLFDSSKEVPFIDVAINRHYLNKTTQSVLLNADLVFESTLEAIVDFCASRGVKPVFVTTPCHRLYRERVPDKFVRKLESVQRRMQEDSRVVFLNYWDYDYPDECFYDGDHLTVAGARRFTEMLIRDVEAAEASH